MTPRVYISGPITKGNRTMNFATAANVQADLMRKGFAVLNPMLSMMHPEAWTIEHKLWLENDLPWVAVSDVVFRLPGESVGAMLECDHARNLGITVLNTWHELMKWKDQWDAKKIATAPCNGT